MGFEVRRMTLDDIEPAVALQRLCFPEPFHADLLWQRTHLEKHHELFPEGQFVCEADGEIVGSSSSTVIPEVIWKSKGTWDELVGGPYLETFDRSGSTLYGLDISVHPGFRSLGIGRELYAKRFDLVRRMNLVRFGTGCRIPDFSKAQLDSPDITVAEYVRQVAAGQRVDRTLSPLLRYGLKVIGTAPNYMEDLESSNSAAILEWLP